MTFQIMYRCLEDKHNHYGHNKFMSNKSSYPKNQNYHMRRQRRLKQPGGSSCDQRR